MFKTIIRPSNKTYSNPSAILLLHGYGSNEVDLLSFADFFPHNYFIISARAPISLQFGGYAWYDIFLDSKNNKMSDNKMATKMVFKLSEFIDNTIEKYSLDKDSFNLLGFSQGAILSYALAFNYPNKFKKIMALSGYINHNIIPSITDNSIYKNLDFYISHGIFDDIIPIEIARKIPIYMKKNKIKHSYNEFSMGHEVNNECLRSMINWFKK